MVASTRIPGEFIPFGKPSFGDEEIAAVTRVLRSGWVGMGPETIEFESDLAEFLGVPYVVTVNSCTSALFLSLLVHGVGPGDEVICPSLTWCSTANVALHLGATPVFCDIDPASLNLSIDSVVARLTDRTKAVVAVHMGGWAVDIDGLRKALPERVAIVEDAAHALGAKGENGHRVGQSGNLTCFSFYANKNLSTGEGGAIAVADEAVAERLRSLRQHGLNSDAWKRYIKPASILTPSIVELGYKMNFMDILASIGRVQLRRQSEFLQCRLKIAAVYLDRLGSASVDFGFQSGLGDPRHAHHLFVVKLPVEQLSLTRDEVVLNLRNRNVGASIHYPPLHHSSLYQQVDSQLPETDDMAQRILTLPISASMSEIAAEDVAQSLLRELGLQGDFQ